MRITAELSPIFKEYLSINFQTVKITRPYNDDMLFDMSPIMQGVYHNQEEDTFYHTPDGLLRRFFEWCLDPNPKLESQKKAHSLIIQLLLYQVLGQSVGNLRSLAQKWYDLHKGE